MTFYVLHNQTGSEYETLYTQADPVRHGPARKCPRCQGYVSMLTWLPPQQADIQFFGVEPGDLAFATADLLVSDRFLAAWREAGLTGITDTYPVKIRKTMPRSVPPNQLSYFVVRPQYEGARLDLARSKLIYTQKTEILCNNCLGSKIIDAIFSVFVEPRSWNGSDLFVLWGLPGCIIATERAVRMADRCSMRNFTTSPASSYTWNPLQL